MSVFYDITTNAYKKSYFESVKNCIIVKRFGYSFFLYDEATNFHR